MRNLWHRPAHQYLVHDSGIYINADAPPGESIMRCDESVFKAIRGVLRRAGYSCRQDVTVHKCIRRGYLVGQKDDVHFHLETSPRGFNLEFYEDVVRDNRNGGRYHFDKMAKMPYLRRKKVELILQKVVAKLEVLGFVDRSEVPHTRARAFVLEQRAELIDFQGDDMYDPDRRQYYNDEDADKIRIRDGEIRYYYNRYTGHLHRGEVWHHINNMWWVIEAEDEVHNVAAFELFFYDPAKHPRRRPCDPLARMKSVLKKLVDREDFEKAIGLRNAIRRKEAVHA